MEAGRFAEAATLLLDGLRFLQDLERGGTNFFVTMMTAVGSLTVVSEIEAMLNAPSPLGDALLADLHRELSPLMATETPAGRFLQAEVLSGLLYRNLPQVRGTVWNARVATRQLSRRALRRRDLPSLHPVDSGSTLPKHQHEKTRKAPQRRPRQQVFEPGPRGTDGREAEDLREHGGDT